MGNYISSIFGASPVGRIQEHMQVVYKCAAKLIDFFEQVLADDWTSAEQTRAVIVDFEHQADALKQQIRAQLPKSLFMPVPREDLLQLLLVQDKIANKVRDVSGLVLGRKMSIPTDIKESFLQFVSRNVDAAKKARKTIRELDELYETGFRGAEAELVESLVEELDAIENDTDRMQAELRAQLFKIEDSLPPIHAIFLYRVIELTGEIGDTAERVGRRLELLLSH